MPSQSDRSESTRTKILDAALHVLVERGYAATSTIRIVERARVSRGAMLHHFPNKASLMAALLRRVLETREQTFHRALSSSDADPLSSIIDAFWKAVGESEAFLPWVELIVAARTEPSLQQVVGAAVDELDRVVEANFRRLFSVEAVPDFVRLLPTLGISVLQGLAMAQVVRSNPERTEQVLTALKVLARTQLSAYLTQAQLPRDP